MMQQPQMQPQFQQKKRIPGGVRRRGQKLPVVFSRRNVRPVLFVSFLFLASFLALPSLFASLVLWRMQREEKDREYQRWITAIAILGGLLYLCWVLLAIPFPAIFSMIWNDAVAHLWQNAAIDLIRFWLVNLMLAPAFVSLLSYFSPPDGVGLGSKPKQPGGHHQEERGQQAETDKGEELNQEDEVQLELARLEKMVAEKEASFSQLPVMHTNVTATAATLPVTGQILQQLGTYQAGELTEYVLNGEFLVVPDFLELHGVIVGEPKFGKTTTLLALVAIAMQYGKKVVYLDLKGSRKTAAQFLALVRQYSAAGRVGVFPLEAYSGWRGDAQSLYNRLMQQVDPASHPFYRAGVGSAAVSLAVKAPMGPPRNSYQFLERLDKEWLEAAYAQDGQALREIRDIAPHIGGIQLVFAGFFRGLAGALDGKWAMDDVDHAYIGMDGVSHREEAAAFGRYILDDAAHYAMSRKDPDEQILLIIDEFGALESTNATRLFESIREAGMAVYAAAQSYMGLGQERDDVLAASAVKILHRCGSPEPIIRYAGQREQYSISRIVGGQGDDEDIAHPLANKLPDAQTQNIIRPQKEFTVPPEEAQQLERGYVIVISGGKAAFVHVKAPMFVQNVLLAAVRFMNQAPRFKPLAPPSVGEQPLQPITTQGKKPAANQKARQPRQQPNLQMLQSQPPSPQGGGQGKKQPQQSAGASPSQQQNSSQQSQQQTSRNGGQDDDFFQ